MIQAPLQTAAPLLPYPPFWRAVHEFQTLIAAVIGLCSVAGALIGIRLQSWLANASADKTQRKSRIATAISIRALILSEGNFPEVSLLNPPSRRQVLSMLKTGHGFDLKAADYVNYLGTMVSSLSGFPRPIAERATFITWLSGRVLLAASQAKIAGVNDEEALRRAAEDVRLLLIAVGEVAMDLGYELKAYIEAPLYYEDRWESKWKSKFVITRWNRSYEDLMSDSFDLRDLQIRVSGISKKEDPDPAPMNDVVVPAPEPVAVPSEQIVVAVEQPGKSVEGFALSPLADEPVQIRPQEPIACDEKNRT